MNQYNYAKDKRTDYAYKRDFDRGTRFQTIAADALAQELAQEGLDVRYILLKDKDFQTKEGNWSYKPDAVMWIDEEDFGLEIKVAVNGFTEAVDFKEAQIKALIDPFYRGMILYATSQEFAFFQADWIKDNYEVSISQKFGGKPCYIVPSADLNWRYWTHKPTFKL